jgi:hypothetical protein
VGGEEIVTTIADKSNGSIQNDKSIPLQEIFLETDPNNLELSVRHTTGGFAKGVSEDGDLIIEEDLDIFENHSAPKGAIFVKVKTANGSFFPLRVFVDNVNMQEAELIYMIYNKIITGTNPGLKISEAPEILEFITGNESTRVLKIINLLPNKQDSSLVEVLNALVYEGKPEDGSTKNPVKYPLYSENFQVFYGGKVLPSKHTTAEKDEFIDWLLNNKIRNVNLKQLNDFKYKKYLLDNNLLRSNAMPGTDGPVFAQPLITINDPSTPVKKDDLGLGEGTEPVFDFEQEEPSLPDDFFEEGKQGPGKEFFEEEGAVVGEFGDKGETEADNDNEYDILTHGSSRLEKFHPDSDNTELDAAELKLVNAIIDKAIANGKTAEEIIEDLNRRKFTAPSSGIAPFRVYLNQRIKGNVSAKVGESVHKEIEEKNKSGVEHDIIGNEEYDAFIKEGKVKDSTLESIAEKVINQENLSKREMAIFTNKTTEVEDIIKSQFKGSTQDGFKKELADVMNPSNKEVKSTQDGIKKLIKFLNKNFEGKFAAAKDNVYDGTNLRLTLNGSEFSIPFSGTVLGGNNYIFDFDINDIFKVSKQKEEIGLPDIPVANVAEEELNNVIEELKMSKEYPASDIDLYSPTLKISYDTYIEAGMSPDEALALAKGDLISALENC